MAAPLSTPTAAPRRWRLPHWPWARLAIIAGILAGLVTTAILTAKPQPNGTTSSPVTSLSQQDLQTLSQAAATNNGSTLVINVNSSFSDGVKVGQGLNVGGDATVAGLLSAANLNLSNVLTVLGRATITHDLSVGGNGSFGGTLGAGSLSANSASIANVNAGSLLTVNGHVISGGSAPRSSAGPALGGGSVVIVGNDYAGTLTLNTGSTPGSGALATVTFHTAYSSFPHVLLTPVGLNAAKLQYYVDRQAGSFTVSSGTAPTAGTTLVFDYLVVQ